MAEGWGEGGGVTKHSPGGWALRAGTHTATPQRVLYLAGRQLASHHALIWYRKGKGRLSGASWKGPHPMSSANPNYLPKASAPGTATQGLRASTQGFGAGHRVGTQCSLRRV